MVKTVKAICIAGIFALIVLFVLFTGNGKGKVQTKDDQKTLTEQSTKASKTARNSNNIDASSVTNFIKNILP
jgi:hypothetical protein